MITNNSFPICCKALESLCDEISLSTLVEVSWRDPYGGKLLLQLKRPRQQEEHLLTALEKMPAFNNDGKDSSASNLFAKTFFRVILKRICLQFMNRDISPGEHYVQKELLEQGRQSAKGSSCGPAEWSLWRRPGLPRALRSTSSAGPSESRNCFPGTICLLCRRSRPYVWLEKKPRTN